MEQDFKQTSSKSKENCSSANNAVEEGKTENDIDSEEACETNMQDDPLVIVETQPVPLPSVRHVSSDPAMAENDNNLNAVHAREIATKNNVIVVHTTDTSAVTLPASITVSNAQQHEQPEVSMAQAEEIKEGNPVMNGKCDSAVPQNHVQNQALVLRVEESLSSEGVRILTGNPVDLRASFGTESCVQPIPVVFQVLSEDGSLTQVNAQQIQNGEQLTTIKSETVSEAAKDVQAVDEKMAAALRPFRCGLCNATFDRVGNYTRHRMVHSVNTKDNYRYKCDVCGRLYLQRCDLKRHMLVHEGNEPYRCDTCGKGYIRRSDLQVHLRFHTKERPFKCQHCDRSYFQSGDLNRHVRQMHLNHKMLTCGHCNRKYAKEQTLIRHMQKAHRDIILKTLESTIDQEQSKNSEEGSSGCTEELKEAERSVAEIS